MNDVTMLDLGSRLYFYMLGAVICPWQCCVQDLILPRSYFLEESIFWKRLIDGWIPVLEGKLLVQNRNHNDVPTSLLRNPVCPEESNYW